MLPVSRVKGRVYFYIYIYIVINRTRMSQTVLREKLEFFSLRKKKPGPDKILYNDRKKTPQL